MNKKGGIGEIFILALLFFAIVYLGGSAVQNNLEINSFCAEQGYESVREFISYHQCENNFEYFEGDTFIEESCVREFKKKNNEFYWTSKEYCEIEFSGDKA